jgi:GT2 family glycosyltransferase
MKLSYVIVTRNRREALLQTLARLEADTGLQRTAWETFVIDNASDDGSADAVADAFPTTHLIRLNENEGVPARNHAIRPARGQYLVFLDDDSYPLEGAIPKALEYLSRHPKTAALVARVLLPSGEAEAPAMPAITIGGASIIRRSVLEKLGGFDPAFIRQAEEYELSCRIWDAGYRVERFEDICFGHDKVPGGRSSSLTRFMDLRNNLIVVERYLPRELRRAYRRDWLRRYAALGIHDGHAEAIRDAIAEARSWARREAAGGRKTLGPFALEAIFNWDAQATLVADWSRANRIRRVAIADISKNLFATWRACGLAKLEVSAVIDHHAAFTGSGYRRVPVICDDKCDAASIDGIVLSNVNPAQIDRRLEELGTRFKLPILRLWHPKLTSDSGRRPKRLDAPGALEAA